MQGLRQFEEVQGTPLVSVFNSARIQSGIPTGRFTFVEAKTALPFGGFVVVLQVSGAQLRATLEVAYDAVRLPTTPRPLLSSFDTSDLSGWLATAFLSDVCRLA